MKNYKRDNDHFTILEWPLILYLLKQNEVYIMAKLTFNNLDQKVKGSHFVSIGYGEVLTDSNLRPLKMTATQYNTHVKDIVKRRRLQGLQNFKSEVTAKLNAKGLWVYSHAVI